MGALASRPRRYLILAALYAAAGLAGYFLWVYFSYLIVPIDRPYEIRIKYRQYDGYYKAEPGRYENPKYGSVFSINSRGFRGREFAAVKGRSVRVVAMGESSTMGLESNDGYTWPERLQAYLRERGDNVEVLNCGIAGHSSPYTLAMWRGEIAGYRPDLILYYAGHNDHHVGNIERHPGPYWAADKSFFRHWFMFKRIQARLLGLQWLGLDIDDWIPWTNRTWSQRYRRNFDTMVSEARAVGIPFVIVTQVQDYSVDLLEALIAGEDKVAFARRLSLRQLAWHLYLRQLDVLAIQREIAARYDNVKIVALHRQFAEAAKAGRVLFFDYIHPTPEGNDLIARTLASAIHPYVAALSARTVAAASSRH